MGLGTKLAIFGRRLKSASLRRMGRNIQAIHQETGKNRLFLFCDMIWCTLHYGVGYLDYHVFGFACNRGPNRKTFMTMNHNVALARMVNDAACYPLLQDKFQFLQRWEEFLGRRWLDLRQAGPEDLAQFCRECGAVFIKPHADFGGKGVARLEPGPETDFEELHRSCVESGRYLVEEAIVQHPEVSALCPQSVNTLRVVTLWAEGAAKFVYALLRVGSGEGNVDNISSGGMYTWVGDDGILDFPAFCDRTGLYYDSHPVTGAAFRGYCLPFFREAVALCCRAAQVEPRLGYVGWDVAITPDGPVLVEGNHLPGYDMAQNARFHPDGKGLLPTFEALLGRPVPKA